MTSGDNLFVYGTLREGVPNQFAELLHRSGRWLGKGCVKGRLYTIADYPGLVPASGDDGWVRGDVYQLDGKEAVYNKLDEYEGCGPNDPLPHEFRREIIPVLLDSGDWIWASVYIYTRDVGVKQEIASGDFLSDR